jgi:hypothetical protein
MKMGRPSKYDIKFCQLVVDIGEEGGSLTEMASACGVLRETMSDWQKRHEEFDNAVKLAQQASQRWWEQKARDATFGKVPGFNATAYIFQMKNRFGHDYQDVHKIDAQSTVNHNHTLKLDNLNADQLEQLASMLRASDDGVKVIEHEG